MKKIISIIIVLCIIMATASVFASGVNCPKCGTANWRSSPGCSGVLHSYEDCDHWHYGVWCNSLGSYYHSIVYCIGGCGYSEYSGYHQHSRYHHPEGYAAFIEYLCPY